MLRARTLPGITFRTETPTLVELPRMDVAGFVGFAERGPIHVPVAVEDPPQFEEIFGGNYNLAWDDQTATAQTACLAPAVRAFFAQGGRRCWVVRVAGSHAATNRFPLPGALQVDIEGYRAVVASARSAGSWSDDLQVAADLLLDSLSFHSWAVQPDGPFEVDMAPQRGQPILPGDLLQIDFSDRRHRAYVALAQQDLRTANSLLRVQAVPQRTHWFRRVDSASATQLTGTAHTTTSSPGDSAAAVLHTAQRLLETTLEVPSGHWVRLETTAGRIWLQAGEASADGLQITAAWFEGHASTVPLLTIARVQRVRLALHVRDRMGGYQTLAELGCAAPHPRFVGYLPGDEALFAPRFGQQADPDDPAAALWAEVRHPRFPLSLDQSDLAVIIPLGLETGPTWGRPLPAAQEPLVRDGLVPPVGDDEAITAEEWASFSADLHLDPALRRTGQRALLTEANDLLYVQGKSLRGLHALLPVDEISMVALPDAAHRGWHIVQRQASTPAPEPEEPVDPCAGPGPFLSCPPDSAQEDNEKASTSPVPLQELPRRDRWNLLPPLAYDDRYFLEVQTAAAMLAAARADMVAVLGMPKHYRTPDALQHQRRLATELRRAGETTSSYVALYHPWIVTRMEDGTLLHTHPSGTVCGVMAARALARGAWVPPANEMVRSALAVTPAPQAGDDAAFYGVGINMVWRIGRGFTVWGAYTQSTDPDLEDLNVRRLLILLRRIALREGQTYAFAPHSPAFQRRVKQQFEQIMALLFTQGAFAGRTPSEGYQIVIDETVNTASSIAQGQMIVELRVAPSQPLTFITVRLVQADSGLLTVQEVTSNGG